MIQIIPLKVSHINYNELIKDVDFKNCYITSQSLINDLLIKGDLPIKNRWIVIKNILDFLNSIDFRMLQKKGDSTLLALQYSIFEKYFTCKHYRKYIKLLHELNVMSRIAYSDGKYYDFNKDSAGSGRCIQYRFHNNYINDDLCMVFFKNDTKLVLEKDNDYGKTYENTILKTQIYFKDAIMEEIDNYQKDIFVYHSLNSLRCRISAILQLGNRRYIKKGSKVDRISHSFSNLSKIARKFLHIKGVKFNELDISNCQPLLLVYNMLKSNEPIDQNYLDACESGLFYETLYDSEETKGMDEKEMEEYRNYIKTETYRCIYFDFKKKEPITIRFAELYPNTYYYLCNYYDSKPEITMASILQNIEASIFNNIMPNKSKNYFTLYDAIYYIDLNDKQQLTEDIMTKFSILGIKPKIK